MNSTVRRRLGARTALVGLLTAGLVLTTGPATSAAPGDKHLPGRAAIAKIFPKLADGDVHRRELDGFTVLESRCDLYGKAVPVRWGSEISVSKERPGLYVQVEAAKLRKLKTAKRAFRSYQRLSTCTKVKDAGDIWRFRPLALPEVGDQRVGMTVRIVLSSGEVERMVAVAVRKGRRAAFVLAQRHEGKKIRAKQVRKLAVLTARKL